MKIKQLLLAGVVMTTLMGCTTVNISNFEGVEPAFRIEDYFAKPVKAWGYFQTRNGEIKKRFVVDIESETTADGVILKERFTNDDGSKESRDWHIKPVGEHRYEGTASDVDGVATGEIRGNALHWEYTLKLPVGDRTWHVQFDDWMFLQPDGVMLNRAKMKKFGFTLGETFISFQQVTE